jgi:DtxR family Mn-dependent transcriptional regulator
VAGAAPVRVTIRRIGEPVQVDPDALALLTSAGILPGQTVSVSREDGRVFVCREGSDRSTGVSLPEEVAVHVFGQTGTPSGTA